MRELNIQACFGDGALRNESTLVTVMRTSHRFMRATAGVVMVAFLGLVLAPSMVGIRSAVAANTGTPVAQSDEARLSETLGQVAEQLDLLEGRLSQGQDTAQVRAALVQLRQTLLDLDAAVTAKFGQIEADLQSKGLPEVILQRQQEMVGS